MVRMKKSTRVKEEEITSAQDPISSEFSDEEDRVTIDKGTHTNNMFSENNLREIM